MKKHWRYLRWIFLHKCFVFRAGSRTGASWWRLLKHDWSKFLPSEWIPYCRMFYGDPEMYELNARIRQALPQTWAGPTPEEVKTQFEQAWSKHLHRNDHHWQHWVYLGDDGTLTVLDMPEAAVREMVADWAGAGRAVTGKWELTNWYIANRKNMHLHIRVQRQVIKLIETLQAANLA